MKPPVAPERDKLTQAILKGTRHPVGWRRPRILPSPADLGDTPEWLREHVAATRAGSYLIGCPHMADGDVTDRRLAIFTVLPSVAVHASKMLAADTPITVITEGRAYDPTGADMDDEGMVLAAAVDRASDEYPNSVVEFDTWDDDPVNPYDKASPVWERLKAATGDIHLARAAIAIRMMAIGVDPDELADVDILDDQSKIKVEQLLERDLPDTLNKSMRNKMRRMAFPHEFDEEEPTLVSAVGDLYDSMRQSNILRKIHEVEADGGVALVMTTPYHAYSLKPVIVKQAEQKKNKSNSDPNMEAVDKGPEQGRSHTPGTARTADLEMAWGRTAAKTFDESIKGKKFKNPETGNQVTFKSLSTDEQEKIRSQWSSKNQGGEAQTAAREAAASIVDGIDRPKGWKSGTEGELTADNRKQWVADTTATSPSGSVMLGLAHADAEDSTTGARSHSDPNHKAVFEQHKKKAVAVAKKAIADGKTVVFLAEGGAYSDDEVLDDPNDWSEQHGMAKALRDATKGKVEQDTWDDGPVDLTDPDSDVWKRMTSAAGNDPVKAKGAMAVFMLGQGESWESLTDQGWVDDAVVKSIRKATGMNPKKLSEENIQSMFRMAFPGDDGEPHNEVSAIGEVYNAARQEHMLNRVKDIEAKGGVAIVAPGSGHAYNLKGAFEGAAKPSKGKTAAFDLEMAWGFNARVAAKISEIMAGINPKVTSGAKSVTPRLKRADPAKGMWTFHVPGSKGEKYIVRVKGLPKGNQKLLSGMDVRVSCTCPFFRWQGPEHWAKAGDYLYGKPVGNASRPDQKDPDARNRVCKHAVAAFRMAERYRAGSDGG